MSYQYDGRPPHQRLDSYQVPHLIKLLRELCGGSIGFDTSRDERTNSKEKLCAYIRASYAPDAIDAAHAKCVATYGERTSRRNRGSRRYQNDASESASTAHNESSGSHSYSSEAHNHANTYANATEQKTVNAETNANTATAQTINDADAKLKAIMALFGGNDSLNADQVRSIVRAEIDSNRARLESQISDAIKDLKNNVRTIELRIPELPPINVGIQHKNFDLLLRSCNARLRGGNRLNIWLYGPAGTGKSTAAEKVAEALNLPFYCVGTLNTSYELQGHRDPNGNAIRTPFREAFENGGVFLFDEIDSSDPRATMALNGALANGVCAFPDKIVKRHPDCVILAGANTTGLGASIEYVGRNKQDAAFLNRFIRLEWPLDEALESHLCGNAQWLERVRHVRRNVASRGVKGVMITPRASLYGEALLAAGIDQAHVESMVLRGGLPDDQWAQIR